MSLGKMLPGQISPWQSEFVLDIPRKLPLKFHQMIYVNQTIMLRLGWGFDKITKDPKQNVNIKKIFLGWNHFMTNNIFLLQECLHVSKKYLPVTRYIFLLKEMSFDKTYLYLWQEITSNSNKSQPVTRNYLLCGGDHSCSRQHLYFKIFFCILLADFLQQKNYFLVIYFADQYCLGFILVFWGSLGANWYPTFDQ